MMIRFKKMLVKLSAVRRFRDGGGVGSFQDGGCSRWSFV